MTYLFVVQQTLCGGKTERVGVELSGLVVIVELQTVGGYRCLQHFSLPVVDGDLQVKKTWLLRQTEDRICCWNKNKTLINRVTTYKRALFSCGSSFLKK